LSRRDDLNGSRLCLSSRASRLTYACFLLLSGLLGSATDGTGISLSIHGTPILVAPPADGNQEARPLEPLTPVERQLSGGESHPYIVTLDKGQYFHAVVNQQGIDVVVRIAGPDGQILTQVDRPNGLLGPEAISLIAKMPGVYRLEVFSLEKVTAQGRYRIKMEALRTATSLDENRIFAEQAVSEGEQLRARGTADSFRQAIEKFEQALATWRSLDERYEEAVALYGIGWSYGSIGEYQKAVSYYDRAFPLMRELNDLYGEAFVLNGLAWGYMYLGETERAYENFSRAFQLHRSLDNARGQAVTLHGMGWVHALRGENQAALNDFSRALALRRDAKDRRGEAITLASIGNIYYRLGDSSQALDGLNHALQLLRELVDQYAEADVLSNIGWVYVSMNENTAALEYLNRALVLRRMTGDRAGEATTLYGLARAEQQLGNFVRSQGRIGEAIRIIESLRTKVASQQLRSSYFASVQEYYEFYVDLLMRMHQQSPAGNYAAQALQISEQARNRNLLDLLTEANVDIRQGIEPSLLEQERALQQQLNAAADRQRQLLSGKHNSEQAAAASSEVASVTAQYQQIETRIHENSPRYAALTQPTPLSAAEIQRQVLDEKTLLLEYALGEKRSFLWAVTPDEVNSYELPKRSEIESAVRRVYDLLTERNRQVKGETSEQRRVRIEQADGKYSEEAATLSRMLLGPVAERLGTRRLLIVAQGALQFIPFGVLPSPVTLNENGGGGTAVITDHEIVSVPSASMLALLRREVRGRKPASKSVAILADPVFSLDDERFDAGVNRRKRTPVSLETSSDLKRVKAAPENVGSLSEHLPRLFISRWEAGEISSLVPAGESLRALDFAASRATALSPELAQYRIIHFATHAIIDNVHPELSGIALSRVNESGQPQDGFLRAHEIFNLKLPAELIVLSACRTGLGKDVDGEGLIGMTRGFMYAGAPRVVVSLWAVNDRATSELMVRFYRKMLGPERLTPAAALRSAQIDMARDKRWQAPYFWGAFTLQGEWRASSLLPSSH
jgi:CHAT domain-containing protein